MLPKREFLQNIEAKEARLVLHPLKEYEAAMGVNIVFAENDFYGTLLRYHRDNKVYVFEQSTDDKGLFIHSILIVGAYEVIVAGEYYVKNGSNGSEILEEQRIDHNSVKISYPGKEGNIVSDIGVKPTNIKTIGVRFTASQLET